MHRADNAGEDRPSLPLQGGVEDPRPASLTSQQALGRQLAIFEDEFAHGCGAHAKLGDLANDVKARRFRSIRKAVMPSTPLVGSVVAKQRKRSATGPPVIHTLRPFKTQRSPLRSARVFMLKMSEPASGSLAPLAPKLRPSHRAGKVASLLGVGAEMTIGIVIVQSDALRAKIRPVSGQP